MDDFPGDLPATPEQAEKAWHTRTTQAIARTGAGIVMKLEAGKIVPILSGAHTI